MNEFLDFHKACELDDIWEGEMEVFAVNGQDVLIVQAPGGEVRAYSLICPHQQQPLIEGDLDECIDLFCTPLGIRRCHGAGSQP